MRRRLAPLWPEIAHLTGMMPWDAHRLSGHEVRVLVEWLAKRAEAAGR